jgi:hypothetical protein
MKELFKEASKEYRAVATELQTAIMEFDQALEDQNRALVIGITICFQTLLTHQKFPNTVTENKILICSTGWLPHTGKLLVSFLATWIDI